MTALDADAVIHGCSAVPQLSVGDSCFLRFYPSRIRAAGVMNGIYLTTLLQITCGVFPYERVNSNF